MEQEHKPRKASKKPVNKAPKRRYMTLRSRKLQAIILNGKAATLKEAGKLAGYSDSYVNGGRIRQMPHYIESTEQFIETLKEKRSMLVKAITQEKVDATKDVAKLAESAKKVHDIHQIVTGGATENIAQYVIVEGEIPLQDNDNQG